LTSMHNRMRRNTSAFLLIGCLLATPALAQEADQQQHFAAWLDGAKAEARQAGISAAILDAAFDGVIPHARILELDRRQPEGRISFAAYAERTASSKRANKAKALARQHRATLEAVSRHYGVPARFILALWGIETDFGTNTGGFYVIEALTTLAYDGRRAAFFRQELMAALRILQENAIPPRMLRGSWAGAMGQCQFMPSSYLRYAQDHNGDGRRDIWSSHADIFASIAHYLATVGWNGRQGWGRAVRLPPRIDPAPWVGLDRAEPLSTWSHRGLRSADGKPLPDAPLQAALIMPDGPQGPAFLVYDNYRTLIDWNRSSYFALSVGMLADRIGAVP
jgi:membrane-bound lytic murein transglycosylase B